MSKEKEIKTNAMRILDDLGIHYKHYTYECKEFVDGVSVADMLGLEHEKVYKTLVTVGNDKQYYVFVIPVEKELDLKKSARSVGTKSVSMVHVKDINGVTGYVRGGCTAIGMKKQFVTRVDEMAQLYETIIVSGGRIGSQIELKPDDFLKACNGEYADIVKE